MQAFLSDVKRAIIEGDLRRAERLAQEARAAAPAAPEVFVALGLIAAAGSDLDTARDWLDRAVGAAPENGDMRIERAMLNIRGGAFDAAKEDLIAALNIDASNGRAFLQLSAIHKMTAGDPWLALLEEAAAASPRSKRNHAQLQYALGKWRDDIGDYDGAFAAYRDANEERPKRFNRDGFTQFINTIIAVWTGDRIDAAAPAGCPSRTPIFIVGMPRSGSTLLERKLTDDSRIASNGEAPEIMKIAMAIARSHPRQAAYPDWARDVRPDAYGGFGAIHVKRLEEKFPDAARVIDKALTNFGYCGFIRAMTPKALIIESRRHPLDTCLSCYFNDLNHAHDYKSDLADLGFVYRQYARLMDHWRRSIDNLISIDYETLVDNADAMTRTLIRQSGLERSAGGSDAAPERSIDTWSAWQARQPVYATSRGRWRNYEKHLGPLIDALGDLAG